MVAFYKHDIAAWRGGTASLTHEQYRVYHVLVEQMMMDEGSILAHERMLAGLSNMSTRAFRATLDQLVELGKIDREGKNLSNARVKIELQAIEKNRQNSRLGGISRGVRLKKSDEMVANTPRTLREWSANGPPNGHDVHTNPNDIKGVSEAPLFSSGSPKREEKRRHRQERYIEESKLSSHPKPSFGGTFDQFWESYPHKVGKEAARRKFEQVRKSGRVTCPELIEAIERYKATKPPDREWCHPTTWLNQGRWQDEPEPASAKPKPNGLRLEPFV